MNVTFLHSAFEYSPAIRNISLPVVSGLNLLPSEFISSIDAAHKMPIASISGEIGSMN